MQAAETQQTASDPPSLLVKMLADRLVRTVAVARALILAGRAVDLAGIEDGIGMLCAKTLDLDPPHARRMLPALHEMRDQIDSLTIAIRRPSDT